MNACFVKYVKNSFMTNSSKLLPIEMFRKLNRSHCFKLTTHVQIGPKNAQLLVLVCRVKVAGCKLHSGQLEMEHYF